MKQPFKRQGIKPKLNWLKTTKTYCLFSGLFLFIIPYYAYLEGNNDCFFSKTTLLTISWTWQYTHLASSSLRIDCFITAAQCSREKSLSHYSIKLSNISKSSFDQSIFGNNCNNIVRSRNNTVSWRLNF